MKFFFKSKNLKKELMRRKVIKTVKTVYYLNN